MNYELAKVLKDAGFPQMPRSDARDVYFKGTKIPFGNIKFAQYENGQVVHYIDEVTIIPTLEELIAACGEGEFALNKVGDGAWWASIRDRASVNGITPIEAVANLWLALPR